MLGNLNGHIGMAQTGVSHIRPSLFCFKAAKERRHKNSKLYKWKLVVCSGLIQETRCFKTLWKEKPVLMSWFNCYMEG